MHGCIYTHTTLKNAGQASYDAPFLEDYHGCFTPAEPLSEALTDHISDHPEQARAGSSAKYTSSTAAVLQRSSGDPNSASLVSGLRALAPPHPGSPVEGRVLSDSSQS